MLRIYVKKPGQLIGHVYKTKKSICLDLVKLLSYGFVQRGVIFEDEWAKSEEPIIEKFELTVAERKIDGRKKLAKSLRWFTWGEVLTPNRKKYAGIYNR